MRLLAPTTVAPGVHQVRAVGSRITVLVSGEEVVLIDAGGPGSMRLIGAGLRELGRSLEQVQLVALTHYHPDHTGGLGGLVQASQARVAAHRLDADVLTGKASLAGPFRSPFISGLMRPLITPLYGRGVESVDYPLEDGDRLPVEEEIRVVHTPGHTYGSVCYHLPEKRLLVVGDALQYRFRKLGLPAASVTADMRKAHESIEKLMSLDFDALCFSHFMPIPHGAKRMLGRLLEMDALR